MKPLHILLFVLTVVLLNNSCKKDKDDDTTEPTPTCNDGAHVSYTNLATDACGDGVNLNLLDATRFEYKYDAVSDSLWFLLTFNYTRNSLGIGIYVMVNVPNGGSTFNFWGTQNTDAYHKLLTVKATGNPPSAYTGTIGISNTSGVNASNYTSLSHDNISIYYNISEKTIKLGLKRTDLLADSEFTNNNISLKIAAAAGSDITLNDDIFNASIPMSFTKNPSSNGSPSVTTTGASNITSNSAVSGGNVISDSGSAVVVRGIVWAAHTVPTLTDFVTQSGSGTGAFVSNISSLSPNVTYYVRAYATNSIGTSYGNEITFTTSPILPTLTTDPITNVTINSATSGGNVTSDGGAPVTVRGVAVATQPSPGLSDIIFLGGSGTGNFVSNMSGLIPNTNYYVRAFATNSAGTAFGNEISFTTVSSSSVMQLDSIQMLYTGTLTYIPANKKIIVTVTTDQSTNMINNQSLYAQDNSAGIMIHFAGPHSFPLGAQLEIEASGLELSAYNGVVQLNFVPLSNATQIGTGTITPVVSTISSINSNYNSLKSKVVTISGVTITGSGIYNGTNTLTDATGTILLYTGPNATFTSLPYPSGQVSITGILTEYNGSLEILIRNLSDVQ